MFDLLDGDVRMKRGTGTALSLDNATTIVDSITFERLPQSVGTPAGVKTTLTVHNGNYTETSSVTHYLRK